MALCPLTGGPVSLEIGLLNVESVFYLKQTYSDPKSCDNVYDYIRVTDLSDVIMHSANPEYDGKAPPQALINLMMPFYNDWLSRAEVLAEIPRYLNLCGPL